MPKNILSEESAQAQLDTLLDYYDIDPESMEADQKKAVNFSLNKIRSGIRQGFIEISDDDGLKITQTLREPPGDVKSISYNRVTGKAKVAMKDNATEHERCYQLVGSITGLGAKAIANLSLNDLKYCEALGIVFLSV